MNGSRWKVLPLLLALAACEEAEAVRVQPLPPLRQISPEERAGLPTVAGAWRLAGWEVRDSVGLAPDSGFARLGLVAVEHQRLDSLAGFYAMGDARVPLFGEVRRDSVVALVALPAPGQGGVLSGRVSGDTLWIEVASVPGTENWPRGARAALVRGNVTTPFVRIAGAPTVLPVDTMADSLRLDSLAMDSLRAGSPGVPPLRPAPAPAARPTGPSAGPGQQRPSPTPAQPAPSRPAPEREPRRPPAERPETTQPPARQQPTAPAPRTPEPPRERPTDPAPTPEPRRERPEDTTPRAPEPRVLPPPQVEPVQPPPRPDVDLPPEVR